MRKEENRKKPDIFSLILIALIILIIGITIHSIIGRVQVTREIVQKNEVLKTYEQDFDELQNINPDICAWIRIDNTAIDYPVVQGTNNMEYLNKDAYGQAAVNGALFLDTRNSDDFADSYSVIYGHHMQDHTMFGDIDNFKAEKFFNKNDTGVLFTPGKTYDLKIVAFMIIRCDDVRIYDPEQCNSKNLDNRIEYIEDVSEYVRKIDGKHRLLALSTCYEHNSEMRSVLLCELYSKESGIINDK